MLVQPTTTIQLDDTTLNVADMTTGVQQLVQVLDTWRQEEVDQQLDLMKTRAALTDIQNQLGAAVKKDLEDKAAAAPVVDVATQAAE